MNMFTKESWAMAEAGSSGKQGMKDRPMAATRKLTRLVAYGLMVLLGISTLEVASYSYLRVVEGYDGEHLMTYEFDEYKNIQPTPNYHNTKGIHHNAQGFREDSDTPREKDANTYRIFIMGGSTAYGLQSMSKFGQDKYSVIRNNETIDAYLEEYLRGKAGNKKVEVINAAITSQYSHHHLIYLNQTVLKFHPDMVVFIDGFNDYFQYVKGFDQFRDYGYQERAHLYLGPPTIEAWAGYTGWWLFRKSHFIHVASKTLRPIWVTIKSIGGKRARVDVEDALQNLEINAKGNFVKMVERNSLILRHEEVVPVFVLQPELAFKQNKVLSPLEQQIYAELDQQWQENFVEFKNRARPLVVDYLHKSTTRTGSVFLDMTDIFGGFDGDAYTDYCHLTPMGNKLLAERIGERILPLLIKPASKA
ncbi:MAG: SGNH/GDSL hydrolase family protein [Nitrospirae bacterium]|nr:SGNH/GDSL hydrolase family protein [Nitrospirota bacterium]